MGVVVALAALVLVGTACDPVVHPVLTELEPKGAPVYFQAMSTDADYAFVRSTAAGNTVPGAGTWRVDRRDGSAVAVPIADAFSQDGHRVRSGSQIWEDGVVTAAPPAAFQYSKDLRWSIRWDPAIERYRRWSLATGADSVIDVGYPLAPGTDPVPLSRSIGISDDGNIAWFPLVTPAGCVTRFVLIDQALTFDHAACTVVVAASGTSFAALSDPVQVIVPQQYGYFGYRHVELWQSFLPAAPSRVLDATEAGTSFSNITLADGGWTLWAVEYGDPAPVALAIDVVAATPGELATFPITVPPGNVDVDVTPNGRWLAFTGGCTGFACKVQGPAAVIDRATGQVEQLAAGPADKGNIAISGDAGVVAYTASPLFGVSGSGWFEQTPVEAPGL